MPGDTELLAWALRDDIITAVDHCAFFRLDLQIKRAPKLAIDVNILEWSGLALVLNDESLWDLVKSAESRILARVTATKWRLLYWNDGKELVAAVATLPGQPGNAPLGGMKCREFQAAVATLSSELVQKRTRKPHVLRSGKSSTHRVHKASTVEHGHS